MLIVPPVGLDPEAARRLARLLDDAATGLTGCAGRVQRLLDQAGVGCLAPADLRDAAGWCGTAAADLRRRARDVQLMERWSTVLVPQPGRRSPVGCNVFVVIGMAASCRLDGLGVTGRSGTGPSASTVTFPWQRVLATAGSSADPPKPPAPRPPVTRLPRDDGGNVIGGTGPGKGKSLSGKEAEAVRDFEAGRSYDARALARARRKITQQEKYQRTRNGQKRQ